jgi:WD40 repeat protein
MQVLSLAFSPDGSTLAAALTGNWVKLWDVHTRQRIAVLEGHTGSASAVAWSPDGRTLASGGGDRTVRLWNAATRREVTVLKHPDRVWGIAFSPTGNALAVACDTGIAWAWIAPRFAETDGEAGRR